MDTLPRVPVCQPPSPDAVPRVCFYMCESWGRAEWLTDSWAPAPRRAQAGGKAPEAVPSPGSTQALSSSLPQMAHLPRLLDVIVSSLLSHMA